jgi:hypothetical protein
MARRYREDVNLPAHHIEVETLKALGAFIINVTKADGGRVQIKTVDSLIEDVSLTGALACLEPGDDITSVFMNIYEPGEDGMQVQVSMGQSPRSGLIVWGPDRTRVLGIAEDVRRYAKKSSRPAAAPEAEHPLPRATGTGGSLSSASKAQSAYLATPSAPPRRWTWWRRGVGSWWRRVRDDLSVEIISGLAVALIVAVVAAVWVIF